MKILLILFSSFIGLFAGTAVGAFFIPEGSGLAGPATALGYGVVGALVALVGSWVAVRKMEPRQITRATMVVGLISVLLGAWLTYRATSQRSPEAEIPGPPTRTERAPTE